MMTITTYDTDMITITTYDTDMMTMMTIMTMTVRLSVRLSNVRLSVSSSSLGNLLVNSYPSSLFLLQLLRSHLIHHHHPLPQRLQPHLNLEALQICRVFLNPSLSSRSFTHPLLDFARQRDEPRHNADTRARADRNQNSKRKSKRVS